MHTLKDDIRFLNWTGKLVASHYSNGRLALQIISHQHEPIATVTVNLPDDNLPPGHIFLKDYSENKSMLEAMILQGIVEDTGVRVQSGFVEIPLCKLLIDIPTLNT